MQHVGPSHWSLGYTRPAPTAEWSGSIILYAACGAQSLVTGLHKACPNSWVVRLYHTVCSIRGPVTVHRATQGLPQQLSGQALLYCMQHTGPSHCSQGYTRPAPTAEWSGSIILYAACGAQSLVTGLHKACPNSWVVRLYHTVCSMWGPVTGHWATQGLPQQLSGQALSYCMQHVGPSHWSLGYTRPAPTAEWSGSIILYAAYGAQSLVTGLHKACPNSWVVRLYYTVCSLWGPVTGHWATQGLPQQLSGQALSYCMQHVGPSHWSLGYTRPAPTAEWSGSIILYAACGAQSLVTGLHKACPNSWVVRLYHTVCSMWGPVTVHRATQGLPQQLSGQALLYCMQHTGPSHCSQGYTRPAPTAEWSGSIILYAAYGAQSLVTGLHKACPNSWVVRLYHTVCSIRGPVTVHRATQGLPQQLSGQALSYCMQHTGPSHCSQGYTRPAPTAEWSGSIILYAAYGAQSLVTGLHKACPNSWVVRLYYTVCSLWGPVTGHWATQGLPQQLSGQALSYCMQHVGPSHWSLGYTRPAPTAEWSGSIILYAACGAQSLVTGLHKACPNSWVVRLYHTVCSMWGPVTGHWATQGLPQQLSGQALLYCMQHVGLSHWSLGYTRPAPTAEWSGSIILYAACGAQSLVTGLHKACPNSWVVRLYYTVCSLWGPVTGHWATQGLPQQLSGQALSYCMQHVGPSHWSLGYTRPAPTAEWSGSIILYAACGAQSLVTGLHKACPNSWVVRLYHTVCSLWGPVTGHWATQGLPQQLSGQALSYCMQPVGPSHWSLGYTRSAPTAEWSGSIILYAAYGAQSLFTGLHKACPNSWVVRLYYTVCSIRGPVTGHWATQGLPQQLSGQALSYCMQHTGPSHCSQGYTRPAPTAEWSGSIILYAACGAQSLVTGLHKVCPNSWVVRLYHTVCSLWGPVTGHWATQGLPQQLSGQALSYCMQPVGPSHWSLGYTRPAPTAEWSGSIILYAACGAQSLVTGLHKVCPNSWVVRLYHTVCSIRGPVTVHRATQGLPQQLSGQALLYCMQHTGPSHWSLGYTRPAPTAEWSGSIILYAAYGAQSLFTGLHKACPNSWVVRLYHTVCSMWGPVTGHWATQDLPQQLSGQALSYCMQHTGPSHCSQGYTRPAPTAEWSGSIILYAACGAQSLVTGLHKTCPNSWVVRLYHTVCSLWGPVTGHWATQGLPQQLSGQALSYCMQPVGPSHWSLGYTRSAPTAEWSGSIILYAAYGAQSLFTGLHKACPNSWVVRLYYTVCSIRGPVTGHWATQGLPQQLSGQALSYCMQHTGPSHCSQGYTRPAPTAEWSGSIILYAACGAQSLVTGLHKVCPNSWVVRLYHTVCSLWGPVTGHWATQGLPQQLSGQALSYCMQPVGPSHWSLGYTRPAPTAEWSGSIILYAACGAQSLVTGLHKACPNSWVVRLYHTVCSLWGPVTGHWATQGLPQQLSGQALSYCMQHTGPSHCSQGYTRPAPTAEWSGSIILYAAYGAQSLVTGLHKACPNSWVVRLYHTVCSIRGPVTVHRATQGLPQQLSGQALSYCMQHVGPSHWSLGYTRPAPTAEWSGSIILYAACGAQSLVTGLHKACPNSWVVRLYHTVCSIRGPVTGHWATQGLPQQLSGQALLYCMQPVGPSHWSLGYTRPAPTAEWSGSIILYAACGAMSLVTGLHKTCLNSWVVRLYHTVCSMWGPVTGHWATQGLPQQLSGQALLYCMQPVGPSHWSLGYTRPAPTAEWSGSIILYAACGAQSLVTGLHKACPNSWVVRLYHTVCSMWGPGMSP